MPMFQKSIHCGRVYSEFAKAKHIHYRRIEGDRFYFFTNYSVLTEFMDQKFSVLDDFRQQAQERGLPLTLSMGISLVRLSMIKSVRLPCRI